jgi:hypothetical protein
MLTGDCPQMQRHFASRVVPQGCPVGEETPTSVLNMVICPVQRHGEGVHPNHEKKRIPNVRKEKKKNQE